MNQYIPLLPCKLQLKRVKIYDMLRVKLEKCCCPLTATYIEKLAALEGILVQNKIVMKHRRLCENPALLFTIIEACKSAEHLGYLGRNVNYCQHLINIVDIVREANYKDMYKWLLAELFEIISSKIGDLDYYQNSCPELQEVVVGFYLNLCSFFLNDAKRLRYVVEVLEKAKTMTKAQKWIPDLEFLRLGFYQMEAVATFMLARAKQLLVAQSLNKIPVGGVRTAQRAISNNTAAGEKENSTHICNSMIAKVRSHIEASEYGPAQMELDKIQRVITENEKEDLTHIQMLTFRFRGVCYYNMNYWTTAHDFLCEALRLCQNECHDEASEAHLYLILGASNAKSGETVQARFQLRKAISLFMTLRDFDYTHKAQCMLDIIDDMEKIEKVNLMAQQKELQYNSPFQSYASVSNAQQAQYQFGNQSIYQTYRKWSTSNSQPGQVPYTLYNPSSDIATLWSRAVTHTGSELNMWQESEVQSNSQMPTKEVQENSNSPLENNLVIPGISQSMPCMAQKKKNLDVSRSHQVLSTLEWDPKVIVVQPPPSLSISKSFGAIGTQLPTESQHESGNCDASADNLLPTSMSSANAEQEKDKITENSDKLEETSVPSSPLPA